MKSYVSNSVSFFMLLMTLGACRNTENNEKSDDHNILFNEQAEAVIKATKEISGSKDSLSIYEKVAELGEILTKLNYKYPPGADLNFTEQQNDSLINLLEKLHKTKESRLSDFKSVESIDSLKNDNVVEK